jgi:hydroxymethylpyrimidine/phosphomethylpyrimidine kinase
MQYERPIIISIAGFDPSGGAGVLADVKTFEQHGCLGMGVVSALTVQTENNFISVEWLSSDKIITQLKPLLEMYSCSVVKIGIIENLKMLSTIADYIGSFKKDIKIIWDTVLSASSGFDLIEHVDKNELQTVLKKMTLITPNTNEVLKLTGKANEVEAAKTLAENCAVLLKGGHSKITKGKDILFDATSTIEFDATPGDYYEKHGSGCILSAAIAAQLASGKNLEDACKQAKSYIEKILNSNKNLLAYHAQ